MRLKEFKFDLFEGVVVNGRCPKYIGQDMYGFWIDEYYFEISLARGILEVWVGMYTRSYSIEDVKFSSEEEHIQLLFEMLDAVESCIKTKESCYIGRWHYTTDNGVVVQYRFLRSLRHIANAGYTIVGVVYPRVLPTLY